MAIATAERLRNPINIGPILDSVSGLVRIDRNKAQKASPWVSIWETSIPHPVVLATVGQCLKHQAALLFPVSPRQNDGVRIWREQTKKDLADHFSRTPRSKEVYKRLREAHMIMPFDLSEIDMTETLSERWQRLRDNIRIGKDRLLEAIKH